MWGGKIKTGELDRQHQDIGLGRCYSRDRSRFEFESASVWEEVAEYGLDEQNDDCKRWVLVSLSLVRAR